MSATPIPEPSARRRIVVLRHGQTDHNASGVWQGQLDTALSARGVKQAKAAARALAALRPTRVVSSDLARAAATAAFIGAECGLEVALDARFREVHCGAWQGMSDGEVARRFPREREAVLRGEDLKRGGHGESMTDVLIRVRAGLADLTEAMGPGECVVVATHGAAARAACAALLDLEMALAWRILGGFGNCHWAELEQGRHGWRLLSWNVSATAGESAAGASPH